MLKFTRILMQNTKVTANYQNFNRLCLSTISSVELKNVPENNTSAVTSTQTKNTGEIRNNMVAAVFASLQNETQNHIETPQTDSRISSASTVNELLSISNGGFTSRKHALKVISILADWSLHGKVKLMDFESDPRFVRLCKILTKTNAKQNKNSARSEDLATILSITADDEAAKLVASITVPQMVKVMSTLAQKKRRSTILLRALSFNITRSSEFLDIKQCSDILYSMAVLNFADDNLLRRVCIDVYKGINDNLRKSSVLGSILTSLGILKYKDNSLLEASSQWIMQHMDICRSQDLFALFITMGVLNYEPPNADEFFEKLVPQLSAADAPKPVVWLDLVWSLILLNRATPEQINTIFSKSFIDSINIQSEQSVPHKLKLVNIDSAVHYLMPNYKVPNLEILPEIRCIEILRSKEKEEMSASVIECLKNLMSHKHIKTKVNTHMGFYIDAECYLDSKCNPILPEKFQGSPEQKKVAILVLDFHDMCKGCTEPTGVMVLATKLLISQGYKVLTVPYTEYKTKDKLVERVQYLETKLKKIAQT